MPLLTMVAGSNVRWEGSKVRQCKEKNVAWHVNLFKFITKDE